MNEITTIACGTRIEIMEDRQDEIHDRAKLTRESLESPKSLSSLPIILRNFLSVTEIFSTISASAHSNASLKRGVLADIILACTIPAEQSPSNAAEYHESNHF